MKSGGMERIGRRAEAPAAATSEMLRKLLQDNHVPIDTWGAGHAKTVEDLFAEVASGESVLTVADGRVIREVTSLVMDVYFQKGKDVWRLIEEKQVFTGGRERIRNSWVSLGEKMEPGEDPELAIHRALKEELQIEGRQSVIEREVIHEDKESVTYPGVLSRHTRHKYAVVLQEKDYRPEGYTEVQPTKTTYFKWERVPEIPGTELPAVS